MIKRKSNKKNVDAKKQLRRVKVSIARKIKEKKRKENKIFSDYL